MSLPGKSNEKPPHEPHYLKVQQLLEKTIEARFERKEMFKSLGMDSDDEDFNYADIPTSSVENILKSLKLEHKNAKTALQKGLHLHELKESIKDAAYTAISSDTKIKTGTKTPIAKILDFDEKPSTKEFKALSSMAGHESDGEIETKHDDENQGGTDSLNKITNEKDQKEKKLEEILAYIKEDEKRKKTPRYKSKNGVFDDINSKVLEASLDLTKQSTLNTDSLENKPQYDEDKPQNIFDVLSNTEQLINEPEPELLDPESKVMLTELERLEKYSSRLNEMAVWGDRSPGTGIQMEFIKLEPKNDPFSGFKYGMMQDGKNQPPLPNSELKQSYSSCSDLTGSDLSILSDEETRKYLTKFKFNKNPLKDDGLIHSIDSKEEVKSIESSKDLKGKPKPKPAPRSFINLKSSIKDTKKLPAAPALPKPVPSSTTPRAPPRAVSGTQASKSQPRKSVTFSAPNNNASTIKPTARSITSVQNKSINLVKPEQKSKLTKSKAPSNKTGVKK